LDPYGRRTAATNGESGIDPACEARIKSIFSATAAAMN
jgi:hypothetical protein